MTVKYVSNTDKDVYTVGNLPEEVIAVIFAYVSRSPNSFRDNINTVIQEGQLGQEKASKFHEKWVLNYGHASVAEHASVHVGIERVSRLFSSLLELSNEYLSFTEYSQRYQKPKKGDFFLPEELNQNTKLKNKYIALNNFQYNVYEKLNDRLFIYLKRTFPTLKGMEERVHFRALEKIAFEDARYALNLAIFTNLGMTGNARAIEDCLVKLLSSPYKEVRDKASEIKEEVKYSVPTLVKYASESPYLIYIRKQFENFAVQQTQQSSADNVKLLDYTGKGNDNPEEFAIEKMVEAILFEYSHLDYESIEKSLSNRKKLDLIKQSVEKLGKHDNPINLFKLIRYEVEFNISEACWHQLLRHRKPTWIFQKPNVYSGLTIPPNIKDAGLEGLLLEAIEASNELYEELVNEDLHEVANYVVTNAHHRRVIGSFDLWELYHLINIRTSEGAQWDIKKVIYSLVKKISHYHPNLVVPALKRVEGN